MGKPEGSSAAEQYDSQGRTPKKCRESPRKTMLRSAANIENVPAAQVDLPDKTGPPEQSPLADDLLVGAGRIAQFLFGDARQRRKVYYLVEQRAIPAFRWGGQVCARRSTLLDFIQRCENEAIAGSITEAAE